MALEINVADNSGQSLVATIERLSDNFFWNDNTSAFESSPSFANKSITLTEGGSENARSYQATVSGLGSPGYILIRIHKASGNTATRGVMQVFVDEGDEIAQVANIYHADIEFNLDNSNSQDEYTATWFLNAERITSGITSPTIQVVRRDTGGDLIASTSMTQIGSTGSYKYDETTNFTTSGESYLVIASATIDGETRTYSRLVSRDD